MVAPIIQLYFPATEVEVLTSDQVIVRAGDGEGERGEDAQCKIVLPLHMSVDEI